MYCSFYQVFDHCIAENTDGDHTFRFAILYARVRSQRLPRSEERARSSSEERDPEGPERSRAESKGARGHAQTLTYFHTSTTNPHRMREAPRATRQVKGSRSTRKLSTSVTTMLALSMVATTETLPSFMAR